jgi:capsular polysaccharide biosynthesis protein
MSQQPLDARASLQIARRHKVLLGSFVLVGLVGGSAYALTSPPKQTSEALVVIPASALGTTSVNATSGALTDSGAQTQVLVAGSDSVLERALPHITPSISFQNLRTSVTVTNPAGTVIAIDGKSTSSAQAVSIANAVSNSYVSYVSSSASPVGRIAARVLQPAANPTGDTLLQQVLPSGLLGAIGGLIIGFVVALGIWRNQPRLRERDAIANSLGVPVLAAVPVSHPADAGGWAKLLDEYEPSVVYAWQLRKMLDQLGISDARSSGNGQGRASSLAVVSLASDEKALALGPQVAAFAASLGLRTILVIGPQQDPSSAATLRTACSMPSSGAQQQRKNPLRTMVADGDRAMNLAGAALVVVVVVIDGHAPQMPATVETGLTVLGVSAGAATAEELAKVATVVVADGRDISGILVADPDPTDRTTGRIPQLRAAQRRTPTRITGIPTESRH